MCVWVCVCGWGREGARERPPHLLLRHVETTAAVRAKGGAGMSLPLVWLSHVHSHIHTWCHIPEPPRSYHHLHLVCLPFLLPPPSLLPLPPDSIIPLLLVLTLRDLCWLWQGCHSDECARWRVSCRVDRDFWHGVCGDWVVGKLA